MKELLSRVVQDAPMTIMHVDAAQAYSFDGASGDIYAKPVEGQRAGEEHMYGQLLKAM